MITFILCRALIVVMICVAVHLGSRLLFSWLVGAKVVEVGYFIGPTLFQGRWRDVTFKIGLLPLGNYAKYDNEEDSPDRFELLPLWKRLIIHGSGVAGLFVLASVCLGPSRAYATIEIGFSQVLMCLERPGFARTMIGRLYDLIQTEPVWLVIAIVAAKLATWNLMPFPPSDGGNFLFDLVQGKKWVPEQASSLLMILWILFSVVFTSFLGYTFFSKVIWL